MSNIIKSASVVRSTPPERQATPAELAPMGRAVLKRRVLAGEEPPRRRVTYTQDSLQEELNRIRLEIDDAQKELRQAKQQAEAAAREVAGLEKKRKALEALEGMSIDDQAKAILQDAQRQAAQIVEEAQLQAGDAVDQLKAQGYLDGLQQGASEARETYSAQHEPDIRKLEALMTELSSLREEMIQENETEIIGLVIAVAERIIGRALEEDPLVLADMLWEVMDHHRRDSFVKIILSPDLLPAEAVVAENVRDAIQQLGRQIDVSVDAESAPGSIIAETPGGFTDLSVQTQLGNLHEALLEA